MDKSNKAVSHMTLDELQSLSDLYMKNSNIQLPFTHNDIADEIASRNNMQAHRAEQKERIYKKLPLAKRPHHRHTARRLIIAISIATLLITLCGVAMAFFPSLFQFIQHNDTITAEPQSGILTLPDPSAQYTTINEALADYGLEAVSPSWIPSRFALQGISIDELVETVNIYAWHADKEGEGFSIIVVILSSEHLDTTKSVFEVDGNYEEFVQNGITHYIDTNMGQATAKWEYKNSIVNITGHLSITELKDIIKSIY